MKHKKRSIHSFLYTFFGIAFLSFLLVLGVKVLPQFVFSYPCANSITCARDLSGLYEVQTTSGEYEGRQVPVPSQEPKHLLTSVLGDTNPSNKHIYVDLAKQRLYAFEGNTLVYSFLVSTGLWNRTPTGDFRIWIKLRYTRMSGGNPAIGTYYNLPNVPYVMFFYNNAVPKSAGYSLHGTYWHSNFGHPMSHGCVNMKTEEVAQLYEWARPTTKGNVTYATTEDPGTLITIYGVAPKE